MFKLMKEKGIRTHVRMHVAGIHLFPATVEPNKRRPHK